MKRTVRVCDVPLPLLSDMSTVTSYPVTVVSKISAFNCILPAERKLIEKMTFKPILLRYSRCLPAGSVIEIKKYKMHC